MNIMNFLRKYLTTKSPTVTPAQITAAQSNLLDKKLLRRAGLIQNDLRDELNKQSLIQFERSSLYTTLDRSLAHPLMSAAVGLFADTATNFNRINNGTVWVETESKEYRYQIEKLLDILNVEENIYDYAWQCVVGSTKISLLNGETPTIREMLDNKGKYIGRSIYSVNPETKEIEVDEIINVLKTKSNAELVRVWLDNGEYLDCTPDHRFMLRNGVYKEAKDLVEGESLMPLYVDINKNKYTKVYNPSKDNWVNKIDLVLTKEYLTKKHIDEQKTVTDIVKESGCGMTAVRNSLKKNNIQIHDWIVEKLEKVLTEEFLLENYVRNKFTLKQVGELVGCNISTVIKYLEKYGIQVRDIREAKKTQHNSKGIFSQLLTKEFLEEFYIKQKLSRREIGGLLGCSETPIAIALKKHKIKPREKNETKKGKKQPREVCLKRSLSLKGKYLGENSPNWKGGISPLSDSIRHLPEYGKWTLEVLKKANYTCEDCSKKGYLEVHHKKEFHIILQEFLQEYNQFSPIEDKTTLIRLASNYQPFWDISNGKTVCLECHNKNHKKVLNHKVIKIEKLSYTEDVYDLTIKKNHNFPTAAGVFIHNCCAFGDLFVRVFGEPGVGIVHIDDNAHPIDVSRLDFNGRLVGFYETPQGYFTSQQSPLLSPWEFVHFKLTGSKKRRMSGSSGNEQYNEYRTVSIMTPDARRITNNYGSSILCDALPIWKRLRLSED